MRTDSQMHFFVCVDFSLQTVSPDFTVKTSHTSKQPHNVNACSRPTFCIEMYCKMSNLFKTLSFAGQACACAFHFVALECRDLLRLRDLRDCYSEADCHSCFDLGRAWGTPCCFVKDMNWGRALTSLRLYNMFFLSAPTFSQRPENVARFVASRFWQFKSPKGVWKIALSRDKVTKLATLFLAVAMHSRDWLGRRETSGWLQTIPCWKKKCICELVCVRGVSGALHTDAVEFTNDKQFANADSTVCIWISPHTYMFLMKNSFKSIDSYSSLSLNILVGAQLYTP